MLVFLLMCLYIHTHRTFADDSWICNQGIAKFINVTSASEVNIYSPGYENNAYSNNLQCIAVIFARGGERIKLEFKQLDIEVFEHCARDKLVIYEGPNTMGPLHGIFCGNHTPNPILSQGNAMTLVFQTDFMIVKKGFHLTLEAGRFLQICPKGQVLCRNRNCYDANRKCNGEDDCGDGTDEENCGKPLPVMKCGTPQIAPMTSNEGWDRVIGGREAIPGSWPWQADLQVAYVEPNGHMCGGTLLNARWVITAAHCFGGISNIALWRVHLGKHNKFVKDPDEQIRYIKTLIVYPDITGAKLVGFQVDLKHDMALVELNAPVKFTSHVSPCCLPAQQQEIPERWPLCYASGWGMTRGTGQNEVLKQVQFSILNQRECEGAEGEPFDNKTMICVAGKEGHEDVCHGDSGGPLVCKFGSEWYVMGATSRGTYSNHQSGLCALAKARTIYAKISPKINWLFDTIQESTK